MSDRTVRLALIQMAYQGTRDATIDSIEHQLRDAAGSGAQIVCLQELFANPYPCQSEDHTNFDFAEAVSGETVQRLQAIAAETALVVVAPIFEKRAQGVYHNTAVVIDADGTIAGKYRKMHIPDDPLYYEKFYFTPGDPDPGFAPVATRYAKLGVGVCWDQWFPEAARLFALAGAEILLYPTAIGWIHEEKAEFGEGQHDAWETVMRSHAITNSLWVGAPNRIGIEGGIEFWGGSMIVSPRGEVVAKASHSKPERIEVDCQLDEIDVVRTHWPFLRDRRIDAYGNLLRRVID